MSRIKPTNIDGFAGDYRYRPRPAAVTTDSCTGMIIVLNIK
jgi:hypothetical protein